MKNSIAVYLEQDPNFSTFTSLVKFSALYPDLHRAANITLIAVPNEVFHEMSAGAFSQLINFNRLTIRSIITHHIIANQYNSNSLFHSAELR